MKNKSVTTDQLEKILKSFITKSKQKNPNFSLRKLSFELGIQSTTLQKIFSGERRLGYHIARDLAPHFGRVVLRATDEAPLNPPRVQTPSRQKPENLGWVQLAVLKIINQEKRAATGAVISNYLGLPEHATQEVLTAMEQKGFIHRSDNYWQAAARNY